MLMQLTVSGLSQGAIYALIALSLTVVFRATTVVNFGHGDFVLGGAFGVYVLVVMLGLPFLPSAIAAIALMFVCGILISRGFIDPIKAGPHIGFAMMSISLGYIFRGTTRSIWGREVLPMPRVFDIPPVFVGDLVITGDAMIVGGTVASLCEAYCDVVRSEESGHWVNMLFDHETEAVRVQSPYTSDGLQVEAKKAGPLWVRIPSWVARESVRVTGATATWSDDYLFVAKPPAGAAVRIDFPLVEQELLLSERLQLPPSFQRFDLPRMRSHPGSNPGVHPFLFLRLHIPPRGNWPTTASMHKLT